MDNINHLQDAINSLVARKADIWPEYSRLSDEIQKINAALKTLRGDQHPVTPDGKPETRGRKKGTLSPFSFAAAVISTVNSFRLHGEDFTMDTLEDICLADHPSVKSFDRKYARTIITRLLQEGLITGVGTREDGHTSIYRGVADPLNGIARVADETDEPSLEEESGEAPVPVSFHP